jgi:hypothetical protein
MFSKKVVLRNREMINYTIPPPPSNLPPNLHFDLQTMSHSNLQTTKNVPSYPCQIWLLVLMKNVACDWHVTPALFCDYFALETHYFTNSFFLTKKKRKKEKKAKSE